MELSLLPDPLSSTINYQGGLSWSSSKRIHADYFTSVWNKMEEVQGVGSNNVDHG